MVAPAPAMMRITDCRPAKADAPAVKSHTFQLTTEEARAAPDVVAGTYLFFSDLCLLVLLMSRLCVERDLSGQWCDSPCLI